MTAFPMNRRLFGDLYPDVETLALAGKIVTRVGSNFRVDSNPEILTAAQIRGMAAKERNRKWEATNAPARGYDGHEITKTPVLDTRAGRDGRRTQTEGPEAAPAKKSRDATERTLGKGEDDGRSRASDAYGVGATTDPASPQRNLRGEGRGDEPIRRDAALNACVSDAGDGRGRCVVATKGTRQNQAGVAPGPQDAIRDAAPSGRVDVVVSDVPPVTTPQTASGPGRSAVTPAPESGAVVGTISDALTANPLGAYCGCGALRNHGGRCWARRGLSGPKATGAKWVAPKRVCERCGGPRSYWSAAFCKPCYQIQRQPGPTQERRIQALEQRAADLEVTVARLLGQMAGEAGR